MAFEKLGLSRNYYFSQIKRVLDKPHKELIEAGYLESAEYEKTTDGKSKKVVYQFVPKKKQQKQKKEQKALSAPKNRLVELLVKERVEKGTAERLVSKHSENDIKIQLRALPYRQIDKNRTGLLIRSIEQNWSLPDEMVKQEKLQLKREEEKQQKEESRKNSESFQRYKNYIATEIEHLKAGSRKAEYERIVREEEQLILKSHPQKRIKDSPLLEDMLNSLVGQRLETEGYIPTYKQWEAEQNAGLRIKNQLDPAP